MKSSYSGFPEGLPIMLEPSGPNFAPHPTSVQELNLRSLQLLQLKGDRAGIWSISVNGNWRLTFKFENGDAYILNYEDYH